MNKILGGVAFLAILPLPYGFYQLARVLICLGILFMAYAEWHNIPKTHKAILILIAATFNPFIPIHLTKGAWMAIDLIAGCYLFFFDKWRQISN